MQSIPEEGRKKALRRKIELFTALLDADRRAYPERKEIINNGIKIEGTMGPADADRDAGL